MIVELLFRIGLGVLLVIAGVVAIADGVAGGWLAVVLGAVLAGRPLALAYIRYRGW